MNEGGSETHGGVGVLEAPVPSPEQEQSVEQEREALHAGTARLIAGCVDTKFLDPGPHEMTDDQKAALTEGIKNKTEQDIVYDTFGSISVESRKTYWEREKDADSKFDTFTAQNQEWNGQVHAWLDKYTKDDADAPDIVADRKAALHSLGFIEPDNDSKENGLFKNVEDFRLKYFKGKSDLKQFVADIANDCRPGENQPVDMQLLQKRLTAIHDVFNAFGTESHINLLVEDYTLAHGLLSSDTAVKQALGPQINDYLYQDIPEPDRKEAYQKLSEAQEQKRQKAEREQELQKKLEPEEGEELDAKKLNDIIERVKRAKENAPDFNDLDDFNKKLDALHKRFNEGSLKWEDFIKEKDRIETEATEKGIKGTGIITVDTRQEFKEVMKQSGVFTTEKIVEDDEHESLHFEEAKALKLNPHYTFQITKDIDENGKSIDKGQAHIVYDDPQGSEDEVRQIYERIFMAPHLERMSSHDLEAVGISGEEKRLALEILKHHAAGEVRPDQELALVRSLQQQRERIKKTYKVPQMHDRQTELSGQEPEEKLSQDEYFNRFASAAADALRIQGVDEDKLSTETFIQALQQQGENTVENWQKVVEHLTQDENISFQPATSIDALLQANREGNTVLIPYNETRFAVLEPGDNIYTDPEGKLALRIHEQDKSKPPVYIPMDSLFRTDLPLLTAQGEKVATKSGNRPSAFIIRKT